jgi:signal transduction histidine kinase
MKARYTFRRRFLAGLAFLAILLISGPISIRAAAPVKNVLILFSGRFYAPLSVEVEGAIRAAFHKAAGVEVELYAETLDMARFDPARHGPILADYLREKFSDRKLDLIISSLPQAARFLMEFRKELFPDTAVVYCLADEAELADLPRMPNIIGVPVRFPWKETLDLALEAHPDTRQVVVVAGTDAMARNFLRQTMAAFQPYETRFTFTYLTDRTLPQLLEDVAKLPPHTVIIYTDMVRDGAGRIYIGAEVSGLVAKAANAPVYAINQTAFGRGVVGGNIVDYGAHATRAAEIGLRILAGETPEAVPVEDVPSLARFDARQLKRWKVPESRLPAGSIVFFKKPSFWERYRLFLIALAVSLLEGLLILKLVLAGARRRRSERRLAESRLEADRLRGELAHVSRVMTVGGMTTAIAHELNQPLGAIMNNAQAGIHVLANGQPRLDEIREILQDVAGDARRAADVIQRLRTLLRKNRQEMITVEINTIIRELATVVRTDALLRRIEIETDLAAELPPVRGDQVQLQQVMLNIILNGIDAMGARGEEGRIRIRTAWDRDAVLVSVSDEGPGIPADTLPHIFEAFYTTKPAGMGMGLAICRTIVEAHGGRIWAENNPEGGATFRFSLPVGP